MRLLARFIDTVVFVIIGWIISIPFGVATFATSRSGSAVMFGILAAALSLVAAGAYECLMVANKGQTLGKMAVGIRIEGLDGRRLDLQEAVIRHSPSLGCRALYVVPILGGLIGGLGLVLLAIVNIILVFSNGTSLYDTIGKTRVVSAK